MGQGRTGAESGLRIPDLLKVGWKNSWSLFPRSWAKKEIFCLTPESYDTGFPGGPKCHPNLTGERRSTVFCGLMSSVCLDTYFSDWRQLPLSQSNASPALSGQKLWFFSTFLASYTHLTLLESQPYILQARDKP